MTSLPNAMAAVLLTRHGGFNALQWRTDVPVPPPPPGEVLIRVGAAGVNNTDINTRIGWYSKSVDDPADDGGWSGTLTFPRVQGADICGRIVAVGAGVEASRIGERVLVNPCQKSCVAGRTAWCWVGSERDGGFAQYATTPAKDAYAIRCDLSDIELASFPCAYSTAENLIHAAGVSAGETVLVTGASGGVGSAAVQLAKRRGARVIGVASSAKAAAIHDLGAERVLSREDDPKTCLGDDAVDVVVDLVGGPRWPGLLDVLRPGGRYAVAGAIAGPLVELDLRTLYLKDLTLLGRTGQDDAVFANLVGYIERGEIRPVVAATYPLQAIVQAQKDFLEKGFVGKMVLIPPEGDDQLQ